MYNKQLETFICVADSGSFSKAAEKLYLSTTAVIKQINLLEDSLGLTLFSRTHRGIVLTASGKSMYNDAKYIIHYSKDSLLRAKNAAQQTENLIRIGTSIMTPARFLMDIWTQIRSYDPKLKFELVSFENTPENAVEILRNLGQNIDIVAGIYDDRFLNQRKCAALKLTDEPVCCAVSIYHPLAKKHCLEITDLYGETLMLIHKGWNTYIDDMREDIILNHPQISIQDFPFYNVSVFNDCESEMNVLMSIGHWSDVHPLLKLIPVNWEYTVPYGLMHSPYPSQQVENFLSAVAKVLKDNSSPTQ